MKAEMETAARIGRRHTYCPQCGRPVREFGELCLGCRSRPRTTWADRINWLLEHQAVWEGYPRPECNHLRLIFMAMQCAGMFSPETHWCDCNIHGLICDARKVRRERAAREARGD